MLSATVMARRSRWNKTSSDLQSQVLSSRSRRKTSLPTSSKAASSSGSVLNRIARFVTGSKKTDDHAEAEAPPPPAPAKRASARSFGFATTKLSSCTDQRSESLFHYKNISSDYMRGISPTREENESGDEGDRRRPAGSPTASASRSGDTVRKARFRLKSSDDDRSDRD